MLKRNIVRNEVKQVLAVPSPWEGRNARLISIVTHIRFSAQIAVTDVMYRRPTRDHPPAVADNVAERLANCCNTLLTAVELKYICKIN